MIRKAIGRVADYTMKRNQVLINPKDRFPRFEALYKKLKYQKNHREVVVHRFETEKEEMLKNGLSE